MFLLPLQPNIVSGSPVQKKCLLSLQYVNVIAVFFCFVNIVAVWYTKLFQIVLKNFALTFFNFYVGIFSSKLKKS